MSADTGSESPLLFMSDKGKPPLTKGKAASRIRKLLRRRRAVDARQLRKPRAWHTTHHGDRTTILLSPQPLISLRSLPSLPAVQPFYFSGFSDPFLGGRAGIDREGGQAGERVHGWIRVETQRVGPWRGQVVWGVRARENGSSLCDAFRAYYGRQVDGWAGGRASERATRRPGERAGRHAVGSTVP